MSTSRSLTEQFDVVLAIDHEGSMRDRSLTVSTPTLPFDRMGIPPYHSAAGWSSGSSSGS